MSSGDDTQQLARALRAAATRAAEVVDGGCALLFAAIPGDDSESPTTRLRAAAGFASADAARSAAAGAMTAVEAAIASGEVTRHATIPALGKRGGAGCQIHPLSCESQVHGALLVGAPEGSEAPDPETLEMHAESAALRIERAHLASALAQLQGSSRETADETPRGEDADELLKLSEALFAQDIELLRSNEKLGKIEKLKNDFIEKMSRELRTPLNSIIEAIIAVLAGEHEAISDQAKASLRVALDEGTAFQRTLQNILDLWRVKQNELPVEIQEVNLGEVVEEAIFSVQDTLGDKPVEIEKVFEGPLPKVRTDLAKINQILFLLLDNAVKFTPSGHVRITVEVEDGEKLECSIEDTGIGVCPDDQEFIFDEFFQVDAHAESRYRGAGLGLSLVRDLVVLLEGEMSVTSEPGKGTRIRFQIPVQ